MKTYQEHERETRSAWLNAIGFDAPLRLSGVACPDCGLELMGYPNQICTSNPPRVQVWCPNRHMHYLTIPVTWGAVAEPPMTDPERGGTY